MQNSSEKHGFVGGKFVGGAAVARINAVRKSRAKGNRILRPEERQRAQQTIPSSLNSFERFFAGLLKGEASDFLNNNGIDTWRAICTRLKLPVPMGRLKTCYNDKNQHFAYRASLVIEEARYVISQGISTMQRRSIDASKTQNRYQRNSRENKRSFGSSSGNMLLLLSKVEVREKTGHCVLTFTKERDRPFTPDEVINLRQGTVFACVSENLAPTVSNAVLGCILASNRDEMISSKSFSVMVFRPVKKAIDSLWQLTAIASLLTEQRKFEACTNNITAKVPFLLPLLGGKKPTHIKFSEENGQIVSQEVQDEEGEYVDEDTSFSNKEMNSLFHVPRLNLTQEKAAKTFLNSQPNTITLIQGPPGTGKTTLLVSVICKYLFDNIKGDRARCLMVCAPTNKAVSVLTTRFLDSLRSSEELPCNVVLVGDDDKLLDDEQSRISNGQSRSRLRSIFLYTWIRTTLDQLQSLQKFVKRPRSDQREIRRIVKLARSLSYRLQSSLSQFPKDMSTALERIIHLLEKENIDGGASREILLLIDALTKEIEGWKPNLIWQEILSSAHIIFCTLASAGAGILKRSIGQIDDLIVDEAAAAAEPELYIPFHFQPFRLLAVGDPKQLPATVLSRTAGERGLDISLHERLMYGCGYKHIMLDIQYRMKPELSQFPSKHFYDGKVLDGLNVVSHKYNFNGKLLVEGQNYCFLQVDGFEKQVRSGSFENYAEAQAVVKLVQQASRQMSGRWQSADRIRVICFYTAQVALIKRLLYKSRLSDVVVATVDSSQGSEADIVLVSFVRSRGHSKSVGFLTDDRRMNVAITRAKYQLVCVGNAESMRVLSNPRAQTVKALAQDAMERNCIVSSQHSKDIFQQKRSIKTELSDDRDSKRARHQNAFHSSNMSPKNLSNNYVLENRQRRKAGGERAKQYGPLHLQYAKNTNTTENGGSKFSLKHSLDADGNSSDDDSSSSDDTSSSDSDSSSDCFVKVDSKAELHNKAVNEKDNETKQLDFPKHATEGFIKEGAEDNDMCENFTYRENEDYESDCKLEDTQSGLDSSSRNSPTQPGIKWESDASSVRSYGDNTSVGGNSNNETRAGDLVNR